MKRNGNAASNLEFNPKNIKPSIPLDIDEVDTALERFIRQKYEHRNLSGSVPRPPVRYDDDSTRSSEDLPPPPPPKSGRRFGFGLRASSSALPLSRPVDDSPPPTPGRPARFAQAPPPAPLRVNKQSRVFGASVGVTEEGNEWKLVTLREMGFPDERRNSNILKGLGGDLDRTVESLIRLGEGYPATQKLRTPTRTEFSQDLQKPLETTPEAPEATPSSKGCAESQEPRIFDTQTQAQAQNSTFSNPVQQSQQPSYNPFETMNLYSAPLQQPLGNFSQSMHDNHQSLFPNSTGGYPSQQQRLQQARLQQSMTPPVPAMPQQYSHTNPYAQQPVANYNPFVNLSQLDSLSMPNSTFQSPIQSPVSVNPFINQATATVYQSNGTVDYQSQQDVWGKVQSPSGNQQASFHQQELHLNSQHLYPQSTYQNFFQQPPQPIVPQRTGRIDKSSILALYNYPHLAPPPLPQDRDAFNINEQASTLQAPETVPSPVVGITQGQRSVTLPATISAGSKNPFLIPGAPPHTPTSSYMDGASRHVSQESADAGSLNSGRHSPDAFASLSSRFVR